MTERDLRTMRLTQAAPDEPSARRRAIPLGGSVNNCATRCTLIYGIERIEGRQMNALRSYATCHPVCSVSEGVRQKEGIK